jgi:hypothetical protein
MNYDTICGSEFYDTYLTYNICASIIIVKKAKKNIFEKINI